MQKQPPARRTPLPPNVPKRATEDGDPIAALTPDDVKWLRSHGWDPDAMPTGEAFLERYFEPALISYDWRGFF